MSQDEKFSDNEIENLQIENEMLRIQLKAQFGDAFQMESSNSLPPEIENQFLKNILAFHGATNTETITVHDKIGKPFYPSADKLTQLEISQELQRIMLLLKKNDILLDFSHGPYPDEEIYRFITEELFSQQTEIDSITGLKWNFIYEEFHPNNRVDIEKNTHKFFTHWFNRMFDSYSWELDDEIITSDGARYSRQQLYTKLNNFFNSFVRFEKNAYNIKMIDVAEQDDGFALGFSEGMYKYDAVMENREILHFEDSYKLYMCRQGKEWRIFNFVMPGFVW